MRKRISISEQIFSQLGLILVAIFVLLPLWGLLRVALDASIKSVPTSFAFFPAEPSIAWFLKIWQTPSQSLSFLGLLRNSLLIAGGAALAAVTLGAGMAYGFARFRFPGRQTGLFAILVGAFLPLVALMTPLYILLETLKLRSSMFGLALVYTAFALPFCIWNMRSAFQAVPVELEEAASLDGASRLQTFLSITLPIALPSIAVAALVSFLIGYSEFAIGWLFVENSQNVTVSMALWGLLSFGSAPWSQLAAFALLMSLPVVVIFLILQRSLFERMLYS